MSRLSRPVPVAAGMERRFHQRLQVDLHNRLRDAIPYGGNAQRSDSAVTLRYQNRPDRWRKVGARRHAIPDLVEIVLEVSLKLCNRQGVDPCCAFACLHSKIRLPNDLLGNSKWSCLIQGLLPKLVDPQMQLSNPTPLLRPRYQASSLLRVGPPLCPASVLWLLRGFRLSFSLYIEATGSHVPHKSLNQVDATFMPDTAWTVSWFRPNSSRANDTFSVLMSSIRLRNLISGSVAFVSMIHT
jgi:hypothetical protein